MKACYKLQLLKNHQIDIEKYTQCLRTSEQYHFQAEAVYLNTLNGGNWEVIVLGDYEAVMPVPIIKKFGVKWVLFPPFLQQLGVFSKKDNLEINELFFSFLKNNYRVIYYAFNAKNKLNSMLWRKNYKLHKSSYAEAFSNYSTSRKRNLKSPKNNEIKISSLENLSEIKPFFFQFVEWLSSDRLKEKYFKHLEYLEQKNLLEIYVARDLQGILLSVAVISNLGGEKALLCFINNKGEKTNAPSVVLDEIIKQFIETHQFNFFGSNIPSVEQFNQRFGAVLEKYTVYHQSKKQLLLQFIGLR
ncbi:hypothetical protein [Riemerella anatipestifer]|uniref:hypothetical protein n=1 Tax=Riemerella anatipestifer TaxID=34085 RepID=UPI0009A1C21C|nr:hypothetical protein [Riemerella anatipestifer]MCO4303613.1 hypothetical protein [Riemerella anatipestifer]MCO7352685.1 hypothetical protein [Riemerella anatipestifer]MCQ4038774.1 hypothetical protein [Riemerella anatipestifer]MCT6760483.1 hypothetical protein [Riemerella anatipestifer]MCT6764844.1 hypothetical protein [Riemerella anatipestifer]